MGDCATQARYWGKHSTTVVVVAEIYPLELSMLGNSLLKYSLNSPDKARVGFSLGNDFSMKVYTLLIAMVSKHIDMTFEPIAIFWLWGYGLWISDFSRLQDFFIYNRKTLWSSQLWHFLSTISHTLCLRIQSCNVFHRTVFVQKKKKLPYFHRTFSPSPELLYISTIHVIQLIDKSIQYIRASHSVSYLN